MASISKKFVDLNPNFDKNPLTKDIPVLKNDAAIRQSMKNIILTLRGEKMFRPYFGSSANISLFENFDAVTNDIVSTAIREAIAAYEPRVEITEVFITQDISNNSIEIDVEFKIVGIPLDTQSLNLILERV